MVTKSSCTSATVCFMFTHLQRPWMLSHLCPLLLRALQYLPLCPLHRPHFVIFSWESTWRENVKNKKKNLITLCRLQENRIPLAKSATVLCSIQELHIQIKTNRVTKYPRKRFMQKHLLEQESKLRKPFREVLFKIKSPCFLTGNIESQRFGQTPLKSDAEQLQSGSIHEQFQKLVSFYFIQNMVQVELHSRQPPRPHIPLFYNLYA